VSRHGKLLADVFMLPEVVQVNHGTRVNPNTGMVEAYTERKVIRARRPMTPAEIEATRNRVVRALHPTTHYAQKNGADVKKKDKES
jgi:hypothetical protein